MGYFDNREALSKRARALYKFNEEFYKKEIEAAVLGSRIYSPDFSLPRQDTKEERTWILAPITSTAATLQYKEGKTAVLNFASYKNPGGAFIDGSSAQEECLCHSSCLYNILKYHADYYDWNNEHKNRGLYLNRGIYTPNVIFYTDLAVLESDTYTVDVITVAAPNWGTASRYNMATLKENVEVLESRINFVLDIAKDNNVDTLILGAFGCGVFKQNAYTVASFFASGLQTMKPFKKVVFAIPQGPNYNMFAEVLRDGCKR